jgi:endonuclease-3 related protein
MNGSGVDAHEVHVRLSHCYGSQAEWWPGREDPFEVVTGAILTQRTTWANANRTLAQLRTVGALTVDGMSSMNDDCLALLLRPSGFYRAKTRALKAFCDVLNAEFEGSIERLLALPTDELRSRLLAVRGIGDETADAILVYAAGRPSFIIDAYTRRLIGRLGLANPNESYRALQRRFMNALPRNAELYAEAHALIVQHGQVRCRPRPRCAGCPLADACLFAADAERREEAP